MTSCVPWWRWLSTRNTKQETPQNHRGQFRGCEKQHSSMQKPEIPLARIPEIRKSSLHGMTFTLTLWSKHRQRRVATKVVRRTTAVKLESETETRDPSSQDKEQPSRHSLWHFEANTDNAGSQRKWWEQLTQWNWRMKYDLLGRPQLVGLVLAACPTAKNGVAVTRDYQASAS